MQTCIDPLGRKSILIGTSLPSSSEHFKVTAPTSHVHESVKETPPTLSNTLPFDPLRLLLPIEKDCSRVISAGEKGVRTFVAAYKEYRRAGGQHCAYSINDLILIEVRETFCISSVHDPYLLSTDEDWLSFLVL